MSAVSSGLLTPRCYICGAAADVTCDVRIGIANLTCARPCCRSHSADTVIAGLHRCWGHHRAIGDTDPLRDGSRAVVANV